MPGPVWKWPPSLYALLILWRKRPCHREVNAQQAIQRKCRNCALERALQTWILWLIAWFHPDFLSTYEWVLVSTWQLSDPSWFPPYCVSLASCSPSMAQPLWRADVYGLIKRFLLAWCFWLVGGVCWGTLWGKILLTCLGSVGKSAVIDLWRLPQV